jgi:hypothetical protein
MEFSTYSKTYDVTNASIVQDRITYLGGPQIDLNKHTGSASADGVTVSWFVNSVAFVNGKPTTANVKVNVEKRPWMIPESVIWSHIDALFAA